MLPDWISEPVGYRISREADNDIVKLYAQGVVEFGLTQADRYHDALFDLFDLIASNPKIARERTKIEPPVRVHPFQAHLVIYRIEGEDVLIIRVRHGHEDWKSTQRR